MNFGDHDAPPYVRVTFSPCLGLSLLAALTLGFALATSAESAKEVFEKTSKSVVLIMTEDAKGQPLALGSGFVVASNTIASNFHVIRGATAGKVRQIGTKAMYGIASVVGLDPVRDVALLEVPNLQAPPLQLRTQPPVTGETIFAVGNPKGLEGTLSSGIVSAMRLVGGEKLLQITAPISPGSSGGPVVDETGFVVGVATATLRGGQALNFAVPAKAVEDLLQQKPSSIPMSKIEKVTPPSLVSSIGTPIIEAITLRQSVGMDVTSLEHRLAWARVVGNEKSVVGGAITNGVSVTLFFSNRSDRTVERIFYRVSFLDQNGEMLDFEDGTFVQTIPPTTTRGTTVNYRFTKNSFNDQNQRDLSFLFGNCAKVECSVVDFISADE